MLRSGRPLESRVKFVVLFQEYWFMVSYFSLKCVLLCMEELFDILRKYHVSVDVLVGGEFDIPSDTRGYNFISRDFVDGVIITSSNYPLSGYDVSLEDHVSLDEFVEAIKSGASGDFFRPVSKVLLERDSVYGGMYKPRGEKNYILVDHELPNKYKKD